MFVRHPLRAEDADAMCNACKNSREKLVVWTILDTGLRVSELCNLTPQNILWQQECLSILGKGGMYGKMSKRRVVPMTTRVKILLEAYFAINDKFPVIPRTAQRMVKDIANRAKIKAKVTPHVLRHTFATNAIQKGISLPTVQKILGHDSIVVTEIYMNFTNPHIVEEFKRKW